VLLDVADEREVMDQVGTAAGRQQFRPGQPQQPRKRDRDDRRGDRGRCAIGGGRRAAQPSERPDRCGGTDEEGEPRYDRQPDRIGQVRERDRGGNEGRASRDGSLRAIDWDTRMSDRQTADSLSSR
jgi:hypothetical protein